MIAFPTLNLYSGFGEITISSLFRIKKTARMDKAGGGCLMAVCTQCIPHNTRPRPYGQASLSLLVL